MSTEELKLWLPTNKIGTDGTKGTTTSTLIDQIFFVSFLFKVTHLIIQSRVSLHCQQRGGVVQLQVYQYAGEVHSTFPFPLTDGLTATQRECHGDASVPNNLVL